VFTWIYRIAVNYCLNRLRRRRVLHFFSLAADAGEDGEERGFEPVDGAPDALATLEARRRWAATRQVIDALPAGQRTVLMLAKFEGLSYREIARALGITEGAVESRLVRAMRRLTAAQESGVPRVSRSEG
jgi:RNA polymerase sigma-70 factor (ECF subfamily)